MFSKHLLLTLCLALSSFSSVHVPASMEFTQPYIRSAFLSRKWSADSSRYIFSDAINADEDGRILWTYIDLPSLTLAKSLENPVLLNIPKNQKIKLGFSNRFNETMAEQFPSISPNSKYVAFVGRLPEGQWKLGLGSPLYIGNLETGSLRKTPINIYGTGENYSFVVIWSADSTSFAVKTVTDYRGIHAYYFYKVDPPLQNVTYMSLEDSRFTGSQYDVYQIFALSSNGKQILMNGRGKIMLYDFTTNERIILTSSFQYNNDWSVRYIEDRYVMYVNNDNLYWYDTRTGITRLGTETWCAEDYQKRIERRSYDISPNGEWIAIITQQQGGNTDKLYLCPVPANPFKQISNIILPPAQPTLVNPLPGGGGE